MNFVRQTFSRAPLFLIAAILFSAQTAFAACTTGTNACCLAGGGTGDSSATRRTWQPTSGTVTWIDTANWATANIPDTSVEEAYIQSDWQIPAWPNTSYSLACVQVPSGAFTATPAAVSVTMANTSAAVTMSAPTATVTMAAPTATITGNTPSLNVTFQAGSAITFTIPSATITMTSANPGVVTWTAHGMVSADTPVQFTTTGALPTAIAQNTTYYVRNIAVNTFRLASTPAGAAMSTLAGTQSGIHTGRQALQINWTGHGLAASDPVVFTNTGGALPTGLTAGTTYYVASLPALTANTFSVSATAGGVAIVSTSTGSGTQKGFKREVVTWTSHGLAANDPVVFTNSGGALPTGITAGTTYYVAATPAPTVNTFAISATAGGTAIFATSDGTGTHTGSKTLIWTWTAHGLLAGAPVSFTNSGGALPAPLVSGTTYYVAASPAPAANTFSVATTVNGTAIMGTSAGTGTHTGRKPSLVTWTAHGLSAGFTVSFTNSGGALPTPFVASTVYYVAAVPAPTANTFYVTATAGGEAIINTVAGSGTHTGNKTTTITWTAHGLAAGTPVKFTNSGGALPSPLVAGTIYYIASTPAPAANTFSVAATAGGDAIINTSAGSGTHTGYKPTTVTWTAHGLTAGAPVRFAGTMPTGLTAATIYYVAALPAPAANTFSIAATNGGVALFSTGTGATITNDAFFLSVASEYFENLNAGSLTTNANFFIRMNGAYAQKFNNVDPINNLIISNGTTVTMPSNFTISSSMVIDSGAGTTLIDGGLTLSYTGTALTIPASATVEVGSGATFTAMGGIIVNGVLKIDAGARVLIGNGKTLQVNAGGLLQMIGTSGNVATLDAAQGGSTYALNVAGSINANYFSISRTTASGLNITTGGSDSIQTLSNGDFHYPATGGAAITLNTAKNLPSPDPSGLGFFDEFAYGNTKNIDATSYTGTAVTINSYSGLGGVANEVDPGSKIAWGTTAALALQVTNRTASGAPASTIAKGAAATLFATYGFALNGTGTSTDLTSLTLTLDGVNVASDVNYIQVFNDTSANCAYNSGVDTQIGSNLTMTGSPPTATLTIPASTLSLSNTTQKCLHVLLSTNSNARTGDTLQMTISGTADVSNSQAYSFSNSGGPPISGTVSTITGTAVKKWNGGNGAIGASQNWNANGGDWTPTTAPVSTDDCQIGPAHSYPAVNGNYTCTNVTLPTNGRMNWASTANTLTVLGALSIGSTYTFLNATTGNITMGATTAWQAIDAATAIPGNLIINNTYNTDGLVAINTDLTVNGNLTLTRGILTVTTGHTLTVLGTITVNGGTLDIDPGGTLNLGDGRTMTINTGGTLNIVGDATQSARFTCNGTATGCAISVAGTGTIAARYYSMSRMAVAGLTIASTASIDATNHLQDGSFTYPIGASPILLTLNRQVPTNALANMTFDTASSAATSPKSILTSTSAGTLTISAYSGDLTNCCTTAPTYLVSWTAPTTTLKLTLEASAPGAVNQGATGVTLARFGLQQTQAGAYSDTDVTSMKVTMQGSQNSGDISAVRLYYDSACSGSGGVQVGSTLTFSGSPPTANFTSLTSATVQYSLTSPPKRCFYVQADVASAATVANTIGVSIQSNADVVNSIGYSFNGSYAPPLAAGTSVISGNSITWTGATNTDWNTTSNWNLARVPLTTDNCIINSVTNNPVISAATANCKSLTIGNGTLTINTGQTVEVYGSFTNTGTLTLTGTASVTIRDNGSTTTNQTLQSSSPLTKVVFNKTAGGYVYIGNQTLTIDPLTIPASQNFTFDVRNGNTLTLPSGATVTSATFQADDAALVKIGNAQTFLVNGGTLYSNGVNDGYPQLTTNKSKFTVNGSGTWSLTATSGTINMTGFLLDYLDTNGFQINGTTGVTNFNGGQFTNLSNTYASVKALQVNTSGSFPASGAFDYIGFNWGANNTPPGPAAAYLLASSTGCSSRTLNLTNWFGDFFYAVDMPVPSTKISNTSCNITMTAAASAVTLTQFKVTPYNAKVVLDWTTGLEVAHQGFNVYRSTDPEAGFVQINPFLIRNPVATGSIHGRYQFYDGSVANGKTYYYKLEDIASNGHRTLHGPLEATPDASLGAAPASASDAIVAGDTLPAPVPTAPDPDTLAGAGQVIAPGITILAKTNHSLRLKIDVPASIRGASDLSPYEAVTIPGYSSSTEANRPELPERTVLVEVSEALTATFREVSRSASMITRIDVVPAKAWTVVGGNLVPSPPVVDAAFYALDQRLPSAAIELGAIVQNQGLSYLPVKIRPLAYNPMQRDINALSQIVVDISLSGVPDWNTGAPVVESGAWGYEGALRVHIKKAGLYQIRYEDLVSLGLEGPFDEANMAKLRLFNVSGELPLEVTTTTGFFSTGDFIRFFAPYVESPSSDRNTLVLIADSVAGLRMRSVSGAVTGYASTQASFERRIQVKTPTYGLFQEAYGEGLDHIFWGGIYSPPQNPGEDRIDASMRLPNLASTGTARLKIYAKGSPGGHLQNPNHHVRIFVNGSAAPQGDVTFQSNEAQVLIFNVPASGLVGGLNHVEIVAVGDLTPGDYDFINIEKIVVDYPHEWIAEAGYADLLNYQTGSTLTVKGFGSEPIAVYDVTNTAHTAVLTGVNAVDAGADGHEVSFGTTHGDSTLGRRFAVVADSAVLSPWSLELNSGSNLQSTAQGADVIYLGPKTLLDAIEPLADLRATQGFRVKRIRIEDVYMEFGHGIRSPDAVKRFLKFANTQWQAPAPKYLVLVGDGTFDPQNQLGHGKFPEVPIYLSKGTFLDYANDNWYASLGTKANEPTLAVGRIPGRAPASIGHYVVKVLAYEAGTARPTGTAASKVILASDSDQVGGEHFQERADQLATQIAGWNSSLNVVKLSRDALGDATLKLGIQDAFHNGAAILHYIGHGAEDRWAGATVFMNADANALVNTTLPFVVAMNCLNGYFYDPEATYQGLADRLLFNRNGGAIAVWASTSLTSPDVQTPFQLALYQTIANNPGIRIGDAIRLAKIAGGIDTGTAEVVNSFTLLGDPMVEMKIPAKPGTTSAEVTTPVVTAPETAATEADAAPAASGSCLAVHRPGTSRPDIGTAVPFFMTMLTFLGGRFYRRRKLAEALPPKGAKTGGVDRGWCWKRRPAKNCNIFKN